jgi:hypothetical protein
MSQKHIINEIPTSLVGKNIHIDRPFDNDHEGNK